MALSSKNPQFAAHYPNWIKMRDAYNGEDQVKAQGTLYLPATPGQVIHGMLAEQRGRKNYEGYKMRAVFPSFVEDAVQDMVGMMHSKPPVIELPAALEPLREVATTQGESLELLLRRINEQQLITGRIGLLLDLPDMPGVSLPYIATYDAETITNWDDGQIDDPTLQTLNLVVLDEKADERNADFEWQTVQTWRVLILGDTEDNETSGLYRQGVFRETQSFNEESLITPNIRGAALEQIPFVFINSTDLLSTPINPPLLKLANLCLAIYRGEADYRQNLFFQSQDTLVVITDDGQDEYVLGAGASINVPIGGDAKFIGVGSTGLPEQRQSLENDRRRAAELGAQLLDATSRSKESGEALKTRVGAQTVNLNQIALAGAAGLERLLRIAAVWVGADPNQVIVTPNMDFGDTGIGVSAFLQLTQAKAAGFPISDESMHALAVENELTIKSFEDEMTLIEDERRQSEERQARIFNAGLLDNPDNQQ